MRCMAGNGSPNLFDFPLRREGRRFPPPLPGVAGGGFLLRWAAPGLLPVLPALRRPSLPARRPWRHSLMTVTHDGLGGSGRGQRTGTSAMLGRRSFPLVSTLHRALAVNRMACRRSLRDRNRGRSALASSACRRRRRRSPVHGVQVRQGLLGHRGRYLTEPGPLRVAVAAVSRAGRCAPLGPAPSTSSTATAPPERPVPPPSPSA
jgi:hypothetical protein